MNISDIFSSKNYEELTIPPLDHSQIMFAEKNNKNFYEDFCQIVQNEKNSEEYYKAVYMANKNSRITNHLKTLTYNCIKRGEETNKLLISMGFEKYEAETREINCSFPLKESLKNAATEENNSIRFIVQLFNQSTNHNITGFLNRLILDKNRDVNLINYVYTAL